MAYHYSVFSLGPGDIPPTKAELAGAMLGLLLNTVDPTRIPAFNNELVDHCIKAGFRPIFRILVEERDIYDIADNPKTQAFLRKFGDGLQSFLGDRAQQLIMFGPIMLTLGKNIQVEGFPGWITKRIRTFSVGTYLSSSFFLRRVIFRICWATSSGQDRLSNIFKDIVSLLKGTSMTHIILTDEYLYSRYRELLSVRLLAENHKGMLAAWRFLELLPEHEMYYAKILYDKETTACLNRNNFPLHITAAVAAARFELPTMVNYRGAENQIQSSTLLANIVHGYLTKRLSLANRAVINEMAMFGSPQEVIEYQRTLDESREEGYLSTQSQERGQPAVIGSTLVRR